MMLRLTENPIYALAGAPVPPSIDSASSMPGGRRAAHFRENRPDGRGCFAPWRAHGRLPRCFRCAARPLWMNDGLMLHNGPR